MLHRYGVCHGDLSISAYWTSRVLCSTAVDRQFSRIHESETTKVPAHLLEELCRKNVFFFLVFWHTRFSKPFCSVIFTLYGHKSGKQKQDNIEYLCLLLNLRWQLSPSKSCKRWKLRVTQKGVFAGCCCRESDHIRTFSKH